MVRHPCVRSAIPLERYIHRGSLSVCQGLNVFKRYHMLNFSLWTMFIFNRVPAQKTNKKIKGKGAQTRTCPRNPGASAVLLQKYCCEYETMLKYIQLISKAGFGGALLKQTRKITQAKRKQCVTDIKFAVPKPKSHGILHISSFEG